MNMMKFAPLMALLALAGCDRSPGPSHTESPAAPRWAISPAPTTFRDPVGVEHTAVWRLDTQTGGVAICYFAPGSGLHCTETVAPPVDNRPPLSSSER